MNSKLSKWEQSDNEEARLSDDDSPIVRKYNETNNKKVKILNEDIDLYCPALPPYLTKKEHEHSAELTSLLSVSTKTLKKESEALSQSIVKKEPYLKDLELGREVNKESILSQDVIFMKSERFQEEEKTVINLDNPSYYSERDKVSLETKKDFQYDQVALITDARYVPFLKHLRRPGVIILSDENLQVVELEKYLPKDLDKSYCRTLFLLVIGVHSATKQVSANYCKVAACNRPLQALNSFADFDTYCENFVKKVHSMLIIVTKSLPCHSKIAVLPPLPISLLSSHYDHPVLHSKQSQFPHYLIDNLGDAISKWYPVWMDKILDISKSTLASNISVLGKLNDNDYKNVQVMNCRKGIDNPSYNLWMKVAEDLIEDIMNSFPSKNTFSKNLVTELKSNENTVNTTDGNNISLLYAENNQSTTVAYDHLVFIGYAVSLKMLPDIHFTSYSQWHLDDTVAVSNGFTLQISALNSKSFKTVLFIIISDISMIGKEENNSECLLKHCEEAITYIKAPSDPNLYMKNISKYVASLRETVTEMKKYCNFQSKFIIAPFTPRIYVPISSIIFHRNMHDHSQKQICTRFLRGSTKQIWNKIVKKFEEVWNCFMLDMLKKNDPTNILLPNIVSVYLEQCNTSIIWKDLFTDPLESECSTVSLWRSCLVSLAVNGWMNSKDCSGFKTNKSDQRPSNLLPIIGDSLMSKKSFDIAESPKKYEKSDSKMENAFEESENKKDGYSKTKIYRNNADVLRFSKFILKDIKNEKANISSTHSIKFKNVFIIGQMNVISPLFDCNIKSSMIPHKFVNFDESDVNIILRKMGKFKENSICCLVFDVSIITKEFMSPWCVKNSCQQPIFGTALRIDNADPMKELDQLISNQLKKVLKFARTLSKHIPAIVLPLSPTRMYLEDGDTPCHLISHKITDMGGAIIYGSYSLWDIAIRSLILSWNNLMELTNKSIDSLRYVTAYVKSNPNIFVIIDNINDFITDWCERDVWKAVVEIFLSSLVPLRKIHNVKNRSSYQPQDKLYVSVTHVPAFLPTELFKKMFLCADRSVIITERKGSFTLEKITLSRALLLVQKLNNFRIGDSIVNANIVGDYDEDDLELNLMQKLFISLSIENIYNDWRPNIINSFAEKIDEVPNICTMKSLPCEKGDSCRGPKVCIYYHSSSDKRRNPFLYHYSDLLCTKPKVYGECEDGDDCSYSHNAYEAKFHPSKYQVKVCPSGSLSDLCNSQDLCKFAHEDSPEMFYNSKWEDLIIFGLQHSLRYFAGAIRAASKIKENKRCKLKVCFMSSSPEFIDILLKASRNLYNTFGMTVCDVENNLSDSDTCQILVGNPSSFACLSASLFSDTCGAIIVDDVQNILNNDVHKGSMQQFFQMVIKGSTNGSLNNVFVCNTYDSKDINDISKIVGLKLKLISFPGYDGKSIKYIHHESSLTEGSKMDSSQDVSVLRSNSLEKYKSRSRSKSIHRKTRRSKSRSRSSEIVLCPKGKSGTTNLRQSSMQCVKKKKGSDDVIEIGNKEHEESDDSLDSSDSQRRRFLRVKSNFTTQNRKSRSCSVTKSLHHEIRKQFRSRSRSKRRLKRKPGSSSKHKRGKYSSPYCTTRDKGSKHRSRSNSLSNAMKKSRGSRSRSRSHSRSKRYRSRSREKGDKSSKHRSRSHSLSRTKKKSRLLRSRSRSDSRSKRSRSRSKKKRTSTITKGEKDNASSNRNVMMEDSKEDRKIVTDLVERLKSAYPPIKENHMTVCSTTLWVGHLPKGLGVDELSDAFGAFGEVEAIERISARDCAYICMTKRHDAVKAMKEVNCNQMKNISLVTWTPGRGMKGKNFKDYWDAGKGCSYIPHEVLYSMDNLDFNELEKGGIIDDRTVPLSLKGYYEGRSLSIQLSPALNALPARPSYPGEWDYLQDSTSPFMPVRTRKLPPCPSPPSLSHDEPHTPVDIKDRYEITAIQEKNQRSKSIKETHFIEDEPVRIANKEHHLTVYSTTLWVGLISKKVNSRDVEQVFNAFGKVLSIEVDHLNSCAYVNFASRQDAETALVNKNLKIRGKKVALSWTPGKGLQEKKFNDFWSMTLGCSYIPYNELINMNIILETLEDGGWIDQESLKGWKSHDSSSILSSRRIHSQNIEDNSRNVDHRHRRFKSRSPERIGSRSTNVCSNDSSRNTFKNKPPQDLLKDTTCISTAKKESKPSSPSSLSVHSAVKLPIELVTHVPGYDTLDDLRKRFGQKLYDEYKLALDNLSTAFEKKFAVFYSVPELYPNYNKYYESFDAMYVVQHRGKNAQHKERLWKLYWKTVYDDIKNDEWENSKNNLVAEFDAKTSNHLPLTQPPAFEQNYSSFSETKCESSHHEVKDYQTNISNRFHSAPSLSSDGHFPLKEKEDVRENMTSDKYNPFQALENDKISSSNYDSSFRYGSRNDSATVVPKSLPPPPLTPIKESSYFPVMEPNRSHISNSSKEFGDRAYSQASSSSECKNLSDFQSVASRDAQSSLLSNEPDAVNQIDCTSYTFAETISLIERLSDDVGFLGPSIKVLIKACKDLGITTKAAYNIFTESENLMLIGMVSDKFKSLCRSTTGDKQHLYEKVLSWIPKLLEDAKNGPSVKIEDIKMDLEAIGRASLGKEPKFALDMIKMTLAYEGIHDPPKEVVNDLFLKVCAVHFSLSME